MSAERAAAAGMPRARWHKHCSSRQQAAAQLLLLACARLRAALSRCCSVRQKARCRCAAAAVEVSLALCPALLLLTKWDRDAEELR